MKMQITQITIVPDGELYFSDNGFTVELEDDGEGNGEYISVKENRTGERVNINPDEWILVKIAIDKIIDQCKIRVFPD